MSKKLIVTAVASIIILVVIIASRAYSRDMNTMPAAVEQNSSSSLIEVTSELDTPWDIAFLPNGDRLVTERTGTLRRSGSREENYPIDDVVERGEGGLLGIAVHPDFDNNSYVYVYFTTLRGEEVINRIDRYTLNENLLLRDKTIIDAIPGGNNHNGGRIAFGPDAKLYATTGEGGVEERAQDRDSLAGKILRVNDDGSIPADNPFGTHVWSWGHRNPQGIAWDSQGRMWATEHGRSGIASGYDEVNRIEKGVNYGWPIIEGSETREGMRAPAWQSGESTTWAPAGIAFYNGVLYFAGLKGQALYQMPVLDDGSLGDLTARFGGEFGRLRAVSVNDGTLYFSTSNRDGRGKSRDGDDHIFSLKL